MSFAGSRLESKLTCIKGLTEPAATLSQCKTKSNDLLWPLEVASKLHVNTDCIIQDVTWKKVGKQQLACQIKRPTIPHLGVTKKESFSSHYLTLTSPLLVLTALQRTKGSDSTLAMRMRHVSWRSISSFLRSLSACSNASYLRRPQ